MMDQTRSGGSPQPSDRLDHNRFVGRTRVAYFSMEIPISPEMPTYSGGLGILAGDTARAAADLDLPMVFVTLVSRAGYLRQELDATGHQTDAPDPWDPARWACPLPAMVAVPIAEAAMLAWSGGFRSLESSATLPAWTCKWLRLSCRRLQLATPRRAFRRSRTEGSNPVPSASESKFQQTAGCAPLVARARNDRSRLGQGRKWRFDGGNVSPARRYDGLRRGM